MAIHKPIKRTFNQFSKITAHSGILKFQGRQKASLGLKELKQINLTNERHNVLIITSLRVF